MKHMIAVLALACAPVWAGGDHKPPPAPPVVQPPASDALYFAKNDKAEHAVIGALAGIAGRLHFRDNRWRAMAVPFGVSMAKELVDAGTPGNRFDAKDLLAGTLGGVLGMWIGDGAIYLTRDSGTTKVVWASTF
jgi:hypothetical protein